MAWENLTFVENVITHCLEVETMDNRPGYHFPHLLDIPQPRISGSVILKGFINDLSLMLAEKCKVEN